MKWSGKRHHDLLEAGYWKHLHRVRVAWLLDRIQREQAARGSLRVLDVGCGDGVITRRIRAAFPDAIVCSVDLDDVRLRRAIAYCPEARYCQGDVVMLPFSDDAFDIVLCHHVIEHVSDDMSLLKECRRVLGASGLFLLGIPQEDSFIGRWIRFVHRRLYAKGEHVNFYSVASMRALLQQAGFSGLEHARFGFLFPNYYGHVLLVWNAVTFAIGHRISQRFDATADSLIFAARKSTPATL